MATRPRSYAHKPGSFLWKNLAFRSLNRISDLRSKILTLDKAKFKKKSFLFCFYTHLIVSLQKNDERGIHSEV